METKERQQFGIATNQIIGGYLYQGGEIEDIPAMLRMIADDYEARIKEEKD